MPSLSADDARAFLAAHPQIESIDLLISDLNGVLRGKRIPQEKLEAACHTGINLPASVFAIDISGHTVEATGLGLSSGDGDRVCRPLAESLKLTPWRPDGRQAQLLLSMEEADGSPFFADPRHVLSRQLARLSDHGLTPVAAVELEFYLLDRKRTQDGGIQPPLSPRDGERASQCQLFAIDELDEYADFLEEVQRSAQYQAVPLETMLKECAPGQFEITLSHGSDVLKACDSAVLLKRLIKGVALNHGFEATFMAKPYGLEAGNGCHVHLSLLDASGGNVFAADNGDPLGTKTLHRAVAGVLELMPASMAVCAPNLNSFRRFQPGLYAPMAPTWGFDNRSVALRIPSGTNDARRIEHRVAGADVNPYLLLAVLLAGIEYGIGRQLTPPAPVVGNAYAQFEPTLTNSWQQALDLLETNETLNEALGHDFVHVFIANRRAERELAMQTVSALEYTWYLKHV